MNRKGFIAALAAIAAAPLAAARLAYERKKPSDMRKDIPVFKRVPKDFLENMHPSLDKASPRQYYVWHVLHTVNEATQAAWDAGASGVSVMYRRPTWVEQAKGIEGVYEVRGYTNGPVAPGNPWVMGHTMYQS